MFRFAIFCACVLLLHLLLILIGVGSACIGSFWRGSLLKNSWVGLIPSALAMFLQAATAALARPLDSGLWADANSCCMELALQKSGNSCLNCGPPSKRVKDIEELFGDFGCVRAL